MALLRTRRRLSLEALEDRAVPAGISAEFQVTQSWGSGLQAQIRLINSTTVAVPNWRLEFDYSGTISSIWDARLVSRSGQHYTVNNAGWNSTLPAGGEVSFGFIASPGLASAVPTNYKLNGQSLGQGQPSLPTLSVDDLTMDEGNGPGQGLFRVRLSSASTSSVTVNWATRNGTAMAGSDYQAGSGSLTFSPGQTEKTFAVGILGDTTVEPDETFSVVLSNAVGATLARGEATATLRNDDVASGQGDFTFSVGSDWGSGFTGQIQARNSTAQTLRDWRLEFDFPGQISSIWNARIVSQTGNHFVLASAGWNDTLAPGATMTVGFNGSPGGGAARPTNFRLYGAGTGTGGGNSAPVANDDTGSTRKDQPVDLAVLINDTDPDGDTLSVASFTQPAHGAVTLLANGSLRYTPAAGFVGNDTFSYVVSDGKGHTDPAQVQVSVTEIPPTTPGVWPERFSAPYVDATLWPTYDFVSVARQTAVKYFTLGFVVADPQGRPAWGGYADYAVNGGGTYDTTMKSQIASLRSLGGDVMVSFGGAANRELAEVITDVNALKRAYQTVIDAYSLTHLDFDIEGAATADHASVDRRSQALAALQADARAAGKHLEIWLTLPVLPTGLTQDGLYVVQSALRYGVDLAGVNIMTMDYGDSAAPNPSGKMGDYAIQAATSLHSQLATLYGSSRTSDQLWHMVGLTPMIGLNDVTTEVFDQQEAREVVAFAVQHNLGRLSMWSINRDYQNPSGQLSYVDLKSSSILQSPLEFSLLFQTYSST